MPSASGRDGLGSRPGGQLGQGLVVNGVAPSLPFVQGPDGEGGVAAFRALPRFLRGQAVFGQNPKGSESGEVAHGGPPGQSIAGREGKGPWAGGGQQPDSTRMKRGVPDAGQVF